MAEVGIAFKLASIGQVARFKPLHINRKSSESGLCALENALTVACAPVTGAFSSLPNHPMPLLKVPVLGIERFANARNRENWSHASAEDRDTIIRAVYQQVLGNQYVMKSERLEGLISLFRHGDLTVRELVRQVAKSGLYKQKFFENCNPYRFIELNFKHLLGRAPQNSEVMLHHFTILQEQGVDAEIDSYVDSAEHQERFGQDVVPHIHGWDYSKGQEGRQFSWLMQLARGAAASVKGDAAGVQSRLNKVVHTNRAIAVNPPVPGPLSSAPP